MDHEPVLLDEALDLLSPKPDGIYVDCTLGGGAHAEALLREIPEGWLYAFDRDAAAISRSRERLRAVSERFTVFNQDFRHLQETLREAGITRVDGVLYDLGVSSFHFDEPQRGFSYRHDAPLDMRMDQRASKTAREVVNTYKENDLKRILFQYGEERFAPRIAKAIVEARKEAPIETTAELVDIVRKALPAKVVHSKGHPARRTFQAIRIEVNEELDALQSSLEQAIELVRPQGRIVVISFHSLEDRIVKRAFKSAATVDHPAELPTMPKTTPTHRRLNRKVIRPTDAEIANNSRASSAKLRALERLRE